MKRKVFVVMTVFVMLVSIFHVIAVDTFAEENVSNEGSVEAYATGSCEGNCEHVALVGTTHYDSLNEAISLAKGQEIQLLKSITISEPIIITEHTVINGKNGNNVFQIDTNTTGHHRQGLFHMNSKNDESVTLTLKNISLINKSWSNSTGVSIRASNQTLNLENVNIDTGHYCVLVGVPGNESEDVNDVAINIHNSKLTGYATVYYRTNSVTHMIMRPVLNVKNSELTGRGYNGYGNGFSTIVYNGTRSARTTITNSILSNTFNATNSDADEGIIQFNSYGAYEEDAVVTISNSIVKTKSTTAAPNLIKYSAGQNLNVGNKVIIDHLTVLVDEHESDLIRVMRNGNELVATDKELDVLLSLEVPYYRDTPNGSTVEKYMSLLEAGDTVFVPIHTTLTKDATIPENVTVQVLKDAKLEVADGVKFNASQGAKLIVEGTVEGIEGITEAGVYIFQNNKWVILADEVTLDKTSVILNVGETTQVKATVTPDNTTDKTVKWISSDNKVATVDSTGKVTAIANGTVTLTATCGTVSAQCQVSVYEVKTPEISIPAPDDKQVIVTVDKESIDVITDSLKEVIDNVDTTTSISEETKQALKDSIVAGKTISVKPEIHAITENDVDQGTLTKIEDKLGTKDEIAQYFELSMQLTADGKPLGTIDELTGKVKFTVTIDESLIKEGRIFYMIRVHKDGSTEKITGTLKGNEFTFETDKFSTYALVADDTKIINEPDSNQTVPDKSKVDTGDTTNITLFIALMGIAVMTMGAINLRRKCDK